MPRVVYTMNVSLDGFVTEETRALSAYVMGRRLYETMLYWETADQDPSLNDDMRAWAAMWKPLPKVVFSRTLDAVQGNARLATGDLAEELARLDGTVAIGGPTLAAEAARLGLLDEYQPRIIPVILGGGALSFWPASQEPTPLQLVTSRAFASQTVAYRYRAVQREP